MSQNQVVGKSFLESAKKRISKRKKMLEGTSDCHLRVLKPQQRKWEMVGRNVEMELEEEVILSKSSHSLRHSTPLRESSLMNSYKEELGVVVSMDDGLVVFTTPSLTQLLGYPKDMWAGRSLLDFVHPRHRASFAGHITSVIATESNGSDNSYSCYLRQYRGLHSSGFCVMEKWVGYLPFQLTMCFKETEDDDPKLYLVINALPIQSAYKYGDELHKSTKFTTRHTASTHLCHIDPEVTTYFGYLPQDIIGRSILEFYHPDDLYFLKEVYQAVMKVQGHLFRSRPYRFRSQNGGFALVETELSSFINPWSRKLEFVICQHTVLRGPPNPDVTTPVYEPNTWLKPEDLREETKILYEEIKCLLNETVVRNCETAKLQVTKRCNDLAVFMENLMDELTKPPNLKVDIVTEEQSFSERDSVMLGEISPHHDYYNSKSSSETPPSYNQLNYNENIQRFFQSNPKTTASDEVTDNKTASGGEEGKISPVIESIGDSKSGGSGLSFGAQSSESNENSGENTIPGSNNNSTENYKPTALTEQLLSRHNEDMEKKMVQKHRKQRSKSDRDTKIKERMKTALDKPQEECNNHGVKRSGSHSWEGEPHKTIKAAHNNDPVTPAIPNHETQMPSQMYPAYSSRPDFPSAAFTSTLMPMYYVPNRRPDVHLFSQQVPYLPSVLYHPVVFSPQPVVYSPVTVLPTPNLSCPPLPPPPPSVMDLPPPPPQVPPVPKPSTSDSFPKEPLESVIQDQKTESNETSLPFDDSSSSFYSLLKTDKSDESLRSSSENDTKQDETVWQVGKRNNGKPNPIKKVAPWIEDIKVTPELVLKYQLRERSLEEVLSKDLQTLESIRQPELVSEQLSQMYLDLEGEGLSQQLILEDSDSSSSESPGEDIKTKKEQQKKYMEYDTMVILFEEDAPLPPPIAQSCS
uniref:Period circadian protein n=1 Tax=Pyrrhocoris apterus TaxID=37000 RepID=A0A8K1ZRJ3_PYRAP|nr:period isoform B [Pyrrhocoris apterus]UHH90580.1 period isoform C [Pyrrhocoris apterus]